MAVVAAPSARPPPDFNIYPNGPCYVDSILRDYFIAEEDWKTAKAQCQASENNPRMMKHLDDCR